MRGHSGLEDGTTGVHCMEEEGSQSSCYRAQTVRGGTARERAASLQHRVLNGGERAGFGQVGEVM